MPDRRPFDLKEGVTLNRVHPQLMAVAGYIACRHMEVTGKRMVITSAARLGEKPSYHNPSWYKADGWCRAFDMRRWYFDSFRVLEKFVMWCKDELDVGALIEPEWMTPEQVEERGGLDSIDPHVHWQIGSGNQLWIPTTLF